MRIGLVCPYSLTIPGGVQGQVLGMARAMRGLGNDVRVLAPCDGPPPESGITPLGNSIPTAANGSVAPLAPDPAAQLRVIRALNDEQFDVVHVHEPMAPGPGMTSLFVKTAPIVATFHAAGRIDLYDRARSVLRRIARGIDVRCAVSPEAEDMAKSVVGGEFRLVFNGVEVDRYAKATPAPTDGRTIFFIGRHEPRKGLQVLLEAMTHLPGDVRLWVAGSGPDTATLQRRWSHEPRIEWLGQISDAEKRARLAGADVFCAPSLGGESFGVVLLEGMAAHTPVVASDLAGYRNVATDGTDAILVPPSDPEALAAAIGSVLEDASVAASLIAGGELRAAELSMENLARLYLDIYADLA